MDERDIITNRVSILFIEKLNLDVTSVETDLIEAGILDSLKLVELVLELEEAFGTKIPLNDIELDSFRSIASIVELIVSQNLYSPDCMKDKLAPQDASAGDLVSLAQTGSD